MKSQRVSPFQFAVVDLQFDFTKRKGKHWRDRPSVEFVRNELIPHLQRSRTKVFEIISDYRQPRPGDADESCIPGTWGYRSEIPKPLVGDRWVKCMNSPIFTRSGIGTARCEPSVPYPDAIEFRRIVRHSFGPSDTIVLFGLTLDCCLLCTAQTLRMFGYNVRILWEGTDTYSGDEQSKLHVQSLVVDKWAKAIGWDEVKKRL